MNDTGSRHTRIDRRTALGSIATMALGGIGAGCLDDGSDVDDETLAGSSDDYSVAIEPVGTLPLEEPPGRWIGGRDFAVDVALCLGELDSLVGMVRPDSVYTRFFEELGLDVDLSDVTNVEPETHQVNKELLYELDPDVIAVDPNRLVVNNGLEVTDLDELERNVAPFFGNYSREARGSGWPNWPDGEYRYYEFSELLLKYAKLFDETDRMEEIVAFREDVITEVTDRLPPESERPRVALLLAWPNPEGRGGAYFLYNTLPRRDGTYGQVQYRQLGAREAFDGSAHETGSTARIGHEAMAAADPDVIVFNFGLGQRDDAAKTADVLRNSPVAADISAVRNDRLYLGGTPYQGPITSLFQFEMLAKQLYPDEFGEFHGVGEIPDDEWLFDRDRLRELIATA
ncbi:ABC transporter substrate-binding protein [Natribaculum luteum]|uniref:ABC transporter substrate-binding protein n=1 Tax=Natribaculum luteum TaxID=1586232 RepID=A0ABD5P613_9EURY|nr:ABC transporter substrate-binding protein [Natribaculum luteum]